MGKSTNAPLLPAGSGPERAPMLQASEGPLPALIEAIQDYIDHHNDTDRGFVWTAKAEDILAKVRRAGAVLDKTRSD